MSPRLAWLWVALFVSALLLASRAEAADDDPPPGLQVVCSVELTPGPDWYVAMPCTEGVYSRRVCINLGTPPVSGFVPPEGFNRCNEDVFRPELEPDSIECPEVFDFWITEEPYLVQVPVSSCYVAAFGAGEGGGETGGAYTGPTAEEVEELGRLVIGGIAALLIAAGVRVGLAL